MTTVEIIGAHGRVARRTIPVLVERGLKVRGVVRREDQLDGVRELGAKPVLLDVAESSTLAISETLRGVDAIVWSAGAGGGDELRTYAVDRDATIRAIEAAKLAAVERFVLVSWAGSHPDHGVPTDDPFFPYADAKLASDEYLRDSGLDFTILGPTTLTDDAPTSRIESFDGPVRMRDIPSPQAKVSRADVASAIADALAEPATIGRFIAFGAGSTPIPDALRTATLENPSPVAP